MTIRSFLFTATAVIVLALAIILGATGLFGTRHVIRRSGPNSVLATMVRLEVCCNLYQSDVGKFPDSLLDLLRPPEGPLAKQWRGPYLDGDLPNDTWGNAFRLEYAADEIGNVHMIISSAGTDGKFDTKDDILRFTRVASVNQRE